MIRNVILGVKVDRVTDIFTRDWRIQFGVSRVQVRAGVCVLLCGACARAFVYVCMCMSA